MLISHPDGREAYLSAKAYLLPKDQTEEVILDFEDIDALAPSWADEFVTPLKEEWGDNLHCVNTDNPSVKVTLDFLAENRKSKE